MAIIIALVSLVLTLLLYYRGTEWLAPAIGSYVILGMIIYWGNKRVFLVSCQKDRGTGD